MPLDQVHVISLDPVHVLLPGAEPLPGFGGVWVVGRQQVQAIEDEGGRRCVRRWMRPWCRCA